MVDLAIEGLGPGELIGGGASSSVFVATRLAFGDRVAVKILKQTLTDTQSQHHFEREARALAELADIPGIVAVLDSGVNVRGEPYLVLPLFENSAQGDVSANGAMAPDRAARMVAAAARAVHGGHERGVIHRDIKPANLLLTNTDDVFVSDFGIAKLTDSSVSASGWLGLTPAYAPPEALEGLPAGVLGDVYSLGATLAALVIGAPPFASTGSESPIALLNRVVNEPAPDLESYGAPPAVAAVVRQAMAKDPAQRFQSGLDVAHALEQLSGQDLAAASAPPVPPVAAPVAPVLPAPPVRPVAPPVAPVLPAPPVPPVAAPVAPVLPAPPVPVPAVVAASTPPTPGTAPNPAHPGVRVSEPQPAASGGSNKVAIGAGLAIVAAAVIGGLFAFGGGGDDLQVAQEVEPTTIVVERSTSGAAEPTAGIQTAPPTAVPTALPTPVPATAVPSVERAARGGPVDIYPDGSGEASSLAAAVSAAEDGDVIRLAAGRYEIPEVIRVSTDVTIIGAGVGETILVGTGTPGVLLFVETPARLSQLSVTSTVVGTQDDAVGLIEVGLSPDMVIDSVLVADAPGFGITVVGSTAVLNNIETVGSRLSGVGVGDGSTLELTNSRSSSNGENGFVVFDDSQVLFMNNESTNNTLTGFLTLGSGSPQLISNLAADNGAGGFQFAETSAAVVDGNTSSRNAESGFAWFENAGGTATANTATDNQLAGFSFKDQAAPSVIANTAESNLDIGFVWTDDSAGDASANRAINNQGFGYALVGNDAPQLRANVAEANRAGAVLAPDETVETVEAANAAGVITVEADGSGNAANIETAIGQAASGDLIRLGAGTHVVSAAVRVSKDLTIVGAGPGLTTVRVTDSNTVFLVENTPMRLLDMQVTTAFTPTADAERFSLVEIDGSPAFAVHNLVFDNSVGIGLGIFGSQGVVTDSQLRNSHWSGLGISEGSMVLAADVLVESNGQSGVVFFEDASGVLAGAVSQNNTFFGYSVQGTSTPKLYGNTATGNDASGFASSETGGLQLVGNTASGNELSGYAWFDESSSRAVANAATQNGSSGFAMSASSSPTLTANNSSENTVDGFTWFETSSGQAVGNTASGNGVDGFGAEDESSPILARNTATENVRRPFNQSGESSATVTDNEFG